MTLYKNKYRIETARKKGWDYATPGHYYITICTKNRIQYFGNVEHGKMELSEIGKIADQYWQKIPNHFHGIILDEYIIMPNHIHGIISIVQTPNLGVSAGMGVSTTAIGTIINQYKRIVTIHMRKTHPEITIWQSRYYDHIIRDDDALNHIRHYIKHNPENWKKDDNISW